MAPIFWTTASAPIGAVGTPYPVTFITASGGTGVGYTYSVISGTGLSAVGLTLSSQGALSGTPVAPETAGAFTVQVVDSGGNRAVETLNLTVYPALAITTPATLPNGEAQIPSSTTFAATGGSGSDYTYTVDSLQSPSGDGLRALVERDHSYRTRIAISGSPFESIGPSFKVTELPPHPSPDRARRIRSAVAQSYMRMGTQPTSTVTIDLDYQSEERFKSSVSNRFHELVSPVLEDLDAESEVRDSKSYIYKVLRKDPDFETLWALTDSGTVGFATALGIPVAGLSNLAWSLPDAAANIASSLELANEILVGYGYFGPIRLDLEVAPGGAIILRDAGLFGTLFRQEAYPHAWPVVIPQYRQALANVLCRAEMTLGFNVRSGDWKSEIADLLNRILRGFGFAADLKTLRGCI